MNIDLDVAVSERNKIIWSFSTPIEFTQLLGTDLTDHRYWLEQVYRGVMREACVIDDCCRRFESWYRYN